MPASLLINAIAAAIKTEIEAVAGVGPVHSRPRHTFEPDKFLELFRRDTDGLINTWLIDIPETPTEEDAAGFLFLYRRRVTVDGWFGGFKDGAFTDFLDGPETTTEMRTLIDAVVSKLLGNTAVFGTAPLNTPRDLVPSPNEIAPFGNRLLHHVHIEFEVESEETKTT